MDEVDNNRHLNIKIGNDYEKGDGLLYFKTINGEKGHIVLNMESVIVNTTTNELTIPNFHYDIPKMIVDEIYINHIINLYEVKIELIDKEHIEISLEWRDKDD